MTKTAKTAKTAKKQSSTNNLDPASHSIKKSNKDGVLPGHAGCRYQAQMCMYLLVSSMVEKLNDFQLRYEARDAGKFDDVVFKNGDNYTFFQMKHHISLGDKNITASMLFSIRFNGAYNLIKYVKSVHDIEKMEAYKDKTFNMCLFTNRNFNLKPQNQLPVCKQVKERLKVLTSLITLDDNINVDIDIENFSDYNKSLSKIEPHMEPLDPKFYNFTDEDLIQILVKQSKPFSKVPKLKNEIKSMLNYITYAVAQPNELLFREIVKIKLERHFIEQLGISKDKVTYFFNILWQKVEDWCCYKYSIIDNKKKEDIIDENVRDEFISANLMKRFSVFATLLPVTNFVGRKTELEEMEEKLNSSKCLLITGLAGVGKSELVKKFIQTQEKPEQKIIWIESESNETIRQSFKLYAKEFKTEETYDDVCDHIIDHIEDVLFVFDNFKKTNENNTVLFEIKKNIFDADIKQKWIFTSRDAGCLESFEDTIEKIYLNGLLEDKAVQLIRSELPINPDQNYGILKSLATTLLCIPKALKDASKAFRDSILVEHRIQQYLQTEPLKYLKPLWTETIQKVQESGADTENVLTEVLALNVENFQFRDIQNVFQDEARLNILNKSILVLQDNHVLSKKGNTFNIHKLAIECSR